MLPIYIFTAEFFGLTISHGGGGMGGHLENIGNNNSQERSSVTRARICKPFKGPGIDSQPGVPGRSYNPLFDAPARQAAQAGGINSWTPSTFTNTGSGAYRYTANKESKKSCSLILHQPPKVPSFPPFSLIFHTIYLFSSFVSPSPFSSSFSLFLFSSFPPLCFFLHSFPCSLAFSSYNTIISFLSSVALFLFSRSSLSVFFLLFLIFFFFLILLHIYCLLFLNSFLLFLLV